MTLLSLEGITASRDGMPVLRDVTLTLHAGELLVVTGPNGAGKTTLVETATGALRPDAGTVTVGGVDLTHSSVPDRVRNGLGFVPEGRRLFPRLTTRENLLVAARVWGLTRAAAREQIDSLAGRFPMIDEKADVRAGDLSGGQQQLLAIARALLTRPRALLLDEPSFGLAPGTWSDVISECRRLAGEGHGVMLVEQRVLEVMEEADRVLLLRNGRLHELDGDPAEGSSAPRGIGVDTSEDVSQLVSRYFSASGEP